MVCGLPWLPAAAAGLPFSWDRSPDPAVIGYRIYSGPASGHYVSSVDAGATNAVILPEVPVGENRYFAVVGYTATGRETLPSNEVGFPIQLSVPPAQVVSPNDVAGFAVSAISPYEDATLNFSLLSHTFGLTIEPAQGGVTWRVPRIGLAPDSFLVIVAVSDGFTSATNSFFVAVDFGAPRIVTDLQDQTVKRGSPVTLRIATTGTVHPAYQWFFNGGQVVGATNGTLGFTAGLTNAGRYHVSVLDGTNIVSSREALLQVSETFQLALQPDAGGLAGLTLGAQDGSPVTAAEYSLLTLQYSTNLLNWLAVTNSGAVVNGHLVIRDDVSRQPVRFYRLLKLP
ncbi:MAG TPA: immunoglobulin domain-containing protein [Verrucomicrobiae bacterium]|nr:immunoglobulin domain-containing protein [Verrucomicrobiae bacterium]